jgi:hypothetical protein
MPLTWIAHQVPVLGMKLARPRWFEATALCIGSMTPDMTYAFSGYLGINSHRLPAAFVVGIPFATVLAIMVRRLLAPVGPACVADAGRFRLRSYAVLAARRPRLVVTVGCATLGIGSHIVLDWFTHPGRPGPRWFGYDNVEITVFGVTESLAGVFQLIGHSFGSILGLALLALIGRRHLLEDWYGDDVVEASRMWRPSTSQLVTFWATVVFGFFIGALWGVGGDLIELLQRTFLGLTLGAILGAVVVRRVGPGPDPISAPGRERATATTSSAR